MTSLHLFSNSEPNLVEIADGCGDLSVVTIGTLAACGIPDKPILEAIDENNLTKVKPPCPTKGTHSNHICGQPLIQTTNPLGHHDGWRCPSCHVWFTKEEGGYEREDSKWVKGTIHRKVDLAKVLERLSQQ